MKKRLIAAFTGAVLMILLLCGAAVAADSPKFKPSISVTPSVAPLDRKAQIVVMGAGYKPGQEVLVLFHDALGVPTALPEVATANDRGGWVLLWDAGSYISKKLVTDGVYSVMAADAKYNVFATTAAAFVDPKAAELPEWAAAAGISKPDGKKK